MFRPMLVALLCQKKYGGLLLLKFLANCSNCIGRPSRELLSPPVYDFMESECLVKYPFRSLNLYCIAV